MRPEARRAALIAATVPLVRAHGFNVSTRQIAEAAGIAEGTIFRVFETKDQLLQEAVRAALDTSETEAALRAIDPDLSLETRIELAATLLQRQMTGNIQLVAAIGMARIPPEVHADRHARHIRYVELLSHLFEPDRARLSCDPIDAARYFQALALGGAHPDLAGGRTLTPAEIASVLVNGVLRR